MCLREETGCGGHVLEAIQDHQRMMGNSRAPKHDFKQNHPSNNSSRISEGEIGKLRRQYPHLRGGGIPQTSWILDGCVCR